MNKPNDIAMGLCSSTTWHTQASTLAQNSRKLQNWSENSRYKSISFWIPPHLQISTAECVEDVANALEKFEEEKKRGALHPVS
jgi:hypothetical protein